jgi:hypothetical protein
MDADERSKMRFVRSARDRMFDVRPADRPQPAQRWYAHQGRVPQSRQLVRSVTGKPTGSSQNGRPRRLHDVRRVRAPDGVRKSELLWSETRGGPG